MKNKTNISNSSIDSAGIPKDYKQAVAELIWNGFDANATEVNILFSAKKLDYINEVMIVDNGDGINYETLSATFGSFLDSSKHNSFQRTSYIKGEKGKGRFSFATFASNATWHTIYKDDEKILEYDITITKSKKDEFEDSNKIVSKAKQTGTSVILSELFGVNGYSFDSEEFKKFLAQEFGWFLYLNKGLGYKITINNEEIQYDHLIADSYDKDLNIKDSNNKNHTFHITYLRWNQTFGDKYYYYFLNNEKREVGKQLTSYNNNAINFHHSIFIESNFFDAFVLSNEITEQNTLFSNTNNNKVFTALIKALNEILHEKQKLFIRGNAAEGLILSYRTKGVFPKFSKNKYDLERKKDLIEVVKELYCVQPKIFKGLKTEQEKSILGFLNLLLDTDERENIMHIVDSVTKLSREERSELSNVLKKSSFSKILATIKLVENRYKVFELLKALVYELKEFTTERKHIQKAIEENYWLFGEQYNLVSADQNFQQLLEAYLYPLCG